MTPTDSFVEAMRLIVLSVQPESDTIDCVRQAVEAVAKMSRIKYHMGQPYIDISETLEERYAALLKRVME